MTDINLEIEQIVDDVNITIDNSGGPGQGVPTGGEKRQVLTKQSSVNYDTAFKYKFYDYLVNVEYTGVIDNITDGKVLTALLDGETIYRFINDTKNARNYPIEDSFYATFNDSTLADLIITRG